MNFIENWWAIIKASYATRLGAALGAYAAFLAIEQTMLTEVEQIAWHVPFQTHWFPFLTAVLGIFGISVARAVSQPNLPK